MKHDRKKTGMIGTGTASNIQTIKTKMMNVFVTKFVLSLDAFSGNLKEKEGLCV